VIAVWNWLRVIWLHQIVNVEYTYLIVLNRLHGGCGRYLLPQKNVNIADRYKNQAELPVGQSHKSAVMT
jgi:hypothetical protein